MKVELPYTKDSFDADAQNRFLWAVASSVKTHVDNLYIKSVAEKTSSRRLSRYLLAASVEVEFAIRVSDAAAQAAMITNDGLTEANLNTELAKQVVPRSAYFARRSSMRVFHLLRVFRYPTGVDHTCSASNSGYPPPWCSRNRQHRRHRCLRLLLSLWNSLLLIIPSQRDACSYSSRSLLCCFRTLVGSKISPGVDNNQLPTQFSYKEV